MLKHPISQGELLGRLGMAGYSVSAHSISMGAAEALQSAGGAPVWEVLDVLRRQMAQKSSASRRLLPADWEIAAVEQMSAISRAAGCESFAMA